MEKNSKIFIAGHNGLVGSALMQNLQQKGYTNLLIENKNILDLTNQHAVSTFFSREKPEYVFLAAAKVGGILANAKFRADFIYENLAIQNNIIYYSYLNNVKKLLFLGSSCIYPKEAPQPINEKSLLTGPLEYTNEPYAIAKISGIKMCESFNLQYQTNFIPVMPTNLYGFNDNFDFDNSHVIPAIIRKTILGKYYREHNMEALKKNLGIQDEEKVIKYIEDKGIFRNYIKLWGSGSPKREFLWSEDMADACVHIMERVTFNDLYHLKIGRRNIHINIGSGKEVSIKELAFLIRDIVGYEGNIVFDTTKPDGAMRKLLDVSKLSELGWKYKIELEEGLKLLIDSYYKKG